MNSRIKILTVLALVFASFQITRADDDEFRRTIRVSGEGRVSAAPDMATIETGVVTQAETATEALDQNNSVLKLIMDDLRAMEIAEKDIQTTQFRVQPVYERGPRGQRKPSVVGYRVSNQLQVKVRDLKALGGLLDKLVRSGSNQMTGIRFGVDDSTALMNTARTKAIIDAKARAKLYADAAGVAVGKVLSIDEQRVAFPRPAMFTRTLEAADSSVPLAMGEQEFTATINVVFELLDQQP